MFPARYFAPRYFAPRYWPKVGADVTTIEGPYRVAAAGSFSSGASRSDAFHAGSQVAGSFVSGAVIGQGG